MIFLFVVSPFKKRAPEANPVGNDCCNILQNRIQFINSNADYRFSICVVFYSRYRHCESKESRWFGCG